MEELLNKLIEKGWKPYWIEKDDIEVCSYEKGRKKISIWYMNWSSPSEWDYDWLFMSLRDLVSKESWLWQFVCENNLVEYDTESWWGEFSFNTDYINWFYWKHIFESNYQYRLIESALCDEDKLEDFILSNIKVDE